MEDLNRNVELYPQALAETGVIPITYCGQQSLSPTPSQASFSSILSSSSNYSIDSAFRERQNQIRANTPEDREGNQWDKENTQWETTSSILGEMKTVQESVGRMIQRLTEELVHVKAEYLNYEERAQAGRKQETERNRYLRVELTELMEVFESREKIKRRMTANSI